MIIYVGGGSGSGKSAYAEAQVTGLNDSRRYYIATMRIWDAEGEKRAQRHREMRADKGFETLECPGSLSAIQCTGGTVLLEDLTNLFTNLWFSSEREGCIERELEAIARLGRENNHLIIVGNDIFSDGCNYGPEMDVYLREQGRFNRMAAAMAAQVYEVACGIPLAHKTTTRREGEGMTLITGGAFQGKLQYAQGALDTTDVAYNAKDAAHKPIFAGLEAWLLHEDKPYDALETLLSKNPELVIICREVGAGIVPMGADERLWRERVGRVCVWLAARAGRVIRVYCGIPTPLKGGLL